MIDVRKCIASCSNNPHWCVWIKWLTFWTCLLLTWLLNGSKSVLFHFSYQALLKTDQSHPKQRKEGLLNRRPGTSSWSTSIATPRPFTQRSVTWTSSRVVSPCWTSAARTTQRWRTRSSPLRSSGCQLSCGVCFWSLRGNRLKEMWGKGVITLFRMTFLIDTAIIGIHLRKHLVGLWKKFLQPSWERPLAASGVWRSRTARKN